MNHRAPGSFPGPGGLCLPQRSGAECATGACGTPTAALRHATAPTITTHATATNGLASDQSGTGSTSWTLNRSATQM